MYTLSIIQHKYTWWGGAIHYHINREARDLWRWSRALIYIEQRSASIMTIERKPAPAKYDDGAMTIIIIIIIYV